MTKTRLTTSAAVGNAPTNLAMLLLVTDEGCGAGTLINAGRGTRYLLTANHCFSNSPVAKVTISDYWFLSQLLPFACESACTSSRCD